MEEKAEEEKAKRTLTVSVLELDARSPEDASLLAPSESDWMDWREARNQKSENLSLSNSDRGDESPSDFWVEGLL